LGEGISGRGRMKVEGWFEYDENIFYSGMKIEL
jgi:hypothetical protein